MVLPRQRDAPARAHQPPCGGNLFRNAGQGEDHRGLTPKGLTRKGLAPKGLTPGPECFALEGARPYIRAMRSRTETDIAPTGRRQQAATGLFLTAAIFAAWLALHLYAMFGFVLSWSSLPLALILAALLCWLSVGMFIASHDAMHGSLVPGGGAINDWVGGFLLFVYAGFGWKRMRAAHFAHHTAPGTAGDPDFSVDHPTRFWPWYAVFLRRYFGWQSIAFVGTVVTVYWLVAGVPVANIVILYGLPAIASSLQLFYFGTYRPHRHDAEGFSDRHNARSDDLGTVASLASCFHFGYHHEHHRAPHIPWWGLPAARRALIERDRLQETRP